MKKLILLLLFGLILSGCSGGLPNLSNLPNLLASPTPLPPIDTATPQPTVTQLPTLDLFVVPTSTPITFTPSALTATSLIPEVLPSPTPLPLPTFSEEFINDVAKNTFFVQTIGFKGVIYSDPVLFWGDGPCTTRNIKITAFVDDPDRTANVYLFLRLHDKKNTLTVGEWSAGAAMIKIDNGSFNYKFDTDNLRRYYYYKNAWIEYQLVAVNEKREILGRTQLFDHNLSLMRCGL